MFIKNKIKRLLIKNSSKGQIILSGRIVIISKKNYFCKK